MIATRHRPQWRRYSGIELRLRNLRDAVLDEKAHWHAGDPVHVALGRAERALETATRCAASPRPTS